MAIIQHIGQEFNKPIRLNLLPGITLPKGYWQLDISWLCHDSSMTEFNYTTYYCGGSSDELDIIIGADVYQLMFRCFRHNSYPGSPNLYINYTLRVDHLILLNLVQKLTKKTVDILKGP